MISICRGETQKGEVKVKMSTSQKKTSRVV